jgi:hypothetical protein
LTPGHKASLCRWSNTPAEAEAAVRACRYHPLGNRSNAGVRGEWGEFKIPRLPRCCEQRAPYRADDRDQPVAGESRCHRRSRASTSC